MTITVILKMTIKGRSPNMRHVVRTQRVDLDWLWERLRDDPGIHLRYVNTKKQLADMLTKGSFTQYTWQQLCDLCNLGPSVSSSTIPLTNKIKFTQVRECSMKIWIILQAFF